MLQVSRQKSARWLQFQHSHVPLLYEFRTTVTVRAPPRQEQLYTSSVTSEQLQRLWQFLATLQLITLVKEATSQCRLAQGMEQRGDQKRYQWKCKEIIRIEPGPAFSSPHFLSGKSILLGLITAIPLLSPEKQVCLPQGNSESCNRSSFSSSFGRQETQSQIHTSPLVILWEPVICMFVTQFPLSLFSGLDFYSTFFLF